MELSLPNAYCMNLDMRSDRWSQITQEFLKLQSSMPIRLERISAIRNVDIPRMGLAETVHGIIRMAQMQNLDYILIVEDDLQVINVQKLVSCLSNVPEDWDILSGGTYYYAPTKMYNDHWIGVRDFCGLHFIIIKNTVYNAILSINGISQHIDRGLGSMVRNGKFKMYLMYPMPCKQRAGFSDIRKCVVDDNRQRLPWATIE